MLIDYQILDDGIVILGDLQDSDVLSLIERNISTEGFKLVLLDPLRIAVSKFFPSTSYNTDDFINHMSGLLGTLGCICGEGTATYVFGKTDSGNNFYKLMIKSEAVTEWQTATRIVCESQKIIHLIDSDELSSKSKYFAKSYVWVDVSKILEKRMVNPDSVSIVSIPIEVHTSEGDWILDPFSKCGNTAAIIRGSKRKFVAIERDCEDFVEAVSKLSKGFSLTNEHK